VPEADPIGLAQDPATQASLTADLRALGLGSGDTVMVHSSLARLGFVSGGAQAVVLALLDAIGPAGTLMMPTHSGELSDPAAWRAPPVPQRWWDTIRASIPAFEPTLTPTRQMGAVVECFRHVDGVLRSNHPTVSAAAVGPNARTIVSDHQLAFGLGESSPQARLYDLDGWVLLLGVSHANNTSLHLSEYRADWPDKPWTTHSSPVVVDGHRRWVTYDDLEEGSDDFHLIGDAFAATGAETVGRVGAAVARLCRARAVVDFGVQWMHAHRTSAPSSATR
jgi:aminoglycoside 3-N-acetyltransferase